MKKKLLVITIFFSIFCCFSALSPVLAANLNDAFKVSDGKPNDNLDTAAGKAGYGVKGANTDVLPFFSKAISLGLSFLGVIFLLLLIYGGYLWMTDQGNEEQVAKAKKIIQTAIIGLIIVVSSYALSWFILNVLVKNTKNF
jgi:hypothetical protein